MILKDRVPVLGDGLYEETYGRRIEKVVGKLISA
jgi:hypothetical protein